MPLTVRSFAKINLGLRIGQRRQDGYHDLRTVYQTIALGDELRVSATPGSGIEVRCKHPAVPCDSTNTCYRMAEVVLRALRKQVHIAIEIKKKLPPQGGLGAASANAASTLLAVERLLEGKLSPDHRLRLAEEIGSDVPLFLVGGTVLGLGHGEQVAPLPDLPPLACLVALPKIGVSTPRAFHDWDRLTASRPSDRMNKLSQWIGFWLAGPYSGVSTRGGNRAEALLLDLVRAGVENDFEKVVFPQHPELRKVKRVLLETGAHVASLSGSGSALFGLFASRPRALAAAKKMKKMGVPAQVTVTMDRATYWKRIFKG